MQPFAIELDDRAVALARAGQLLASSPATIFDGSAAEVAGTDAWHALRSHPTVTSSRHLASALTQPEVSERTLDLVAADLARRLEVHRPTHDEPVWIASPAFADPGGLGAVLGILRGASLQVGGFVDSATASVAALGLDRSAIVLELGLHHAAATAVDVGGGMARRRRAVVSERGGLIELYQAWLEFISTAMVKRTRFDLLHDAVTEQQLFDAIPGLVRDASAGIARAQFTRGTDAFEVELSQDQFSSVAQFLNRDILRLVHELRPAGTPVALVMPACVAAIPGLREQIDQFVGCDLVALADGFAATALSAADLPALAMDAPVQLVRRWPLQWQEALAALISRERLGARKASGPPPTHLLLDGRALEIGSDALVVGRAPGGARSVALPDGLAGVSRRHCTLVRDGHDLILLDHSSFGTFVNGERVAERVRVYAGDKVRLGDPGVEFGLIAVGEPAAVPP